MSEIPVYLKAWTRNSMTKIGGQSAMAWFTSEAAPEIAARAKGLPIQLALPLYCIGSAMYDVQSARNAFDAIAALALRGHEFTVEDLTWMKMSVLGGKAVSSEEIIELTTKVRQPDVEQYLIQRVSHLPKTERVFRAYVSYLDDLDLRKQLLIDLASMVNDHRNLDPAPRFHGDAEPEQWRKLVDFWKRMSLEEAKKLRAKNLGGSRS